MKYIDKVKNIFPNDCSIIGKERFLNSAVLIPIVVIDEKEYLLFEKRSSNVRQPGEISFPGGHIDYKNDKDSLSTAIRETTEELGISGNAINVIGRLGILVTPMGIIVDAFVGLLKLNNINELEIDKREVEKVFLVSLDYFSDNAPHEYNTRLEIHPYLLNKDGIKEELLPVKDLGLPEAYALSWTKGRHRVLVYKTDIEIIWGITAELIFELTNRMKNATD